MEELANLEAERGNPEYLDDAKHKKIRFADVGKNGEMMRILFGL